MPSRPAAPRPGGGRRWQSSAPQPEPPNRQRLDSEPAAAEGRPTPEPVADPTSRQPTSYPPTPYETERSATESGPVVHEPDEELDQVDPALSAELEGLDSSPALLVQPPIVQPPIVQPPIVQPPIEPLPELITAELVEPSLVEQSVVEQAELDQPSASTPQPKSRSGIRGTPRDVSRRRTGNRRSPTPRPVPAGLRVLRSFAVSALSVGGPRVRAIVRWLLRLVVNAVNFWQRSLQVRVVASTLILGVAATAIVGAVIAEQIGDRLLDARRQQSFRDAARQTEQFSQDLKTKVDPSIEDNEDVLLRAVKKSLENQQAGSTDTAMGVAVLRQQGAASSPIVEYSTVPTSLITDIFRKRVQASPRQQTMQLSLTNASGATVPGLIVGQRVTLPGSAGEAELYFVISMEQDQRTLDSIERVLAGGLLAIVVLVAAIAWVVSRQVVDPIKEAANVAERLATGSLDERMDPRGRDDFAVLAQAFNEMADSLQEQIEAMEELSRLQRRFVSDVSHELRTPLTTIRMAASVIDDERADFSPVVARSSELLSTQLDRFEALLADLLEISRFDAGAAALDLDDTDLLMVVRRVIDLAIPLAENKNAPLIFHEPTGGARAEVDSRRVERIVRNLVVNAVEHSEGQPVEVYVASDAKTAAVLVVDHGIGLRPGDAARVFDRFWRADPARARTTGGTGLGLAISLEDAHLHGGSLRAWGAPGVGARFLLLLPVIAGGVPDGSPLRLVPEGYEEDAAEPEETIDVTWLSPIDQDSVLSDLADLVAPEPKRLRRRRR